MGYKPDGYSSVSPYIVADGAEQLAEALTFVFGAVETRRFDNHDGTIMHAELKIDDSIIMISDSTEASPANRLLLHVYVADVDAVYERALESGFVSLEAPHFREGDPDRDLVQPLKPPLSLDDVLVVPLDFFRLRQPTFEIAGDHLRCGGVELRRILELAGAGLELVLAKVGATPEHEPDTSLLPAVADRWVAVEKPNRMTVPDLALRLRQVLIDQRSEQRASLPVALLLTIVEGRDIWMHVMPLPRRF